MEMEFGNGVVAFLFPHPIYLSSNIESYYSHVSDFLLYPLKQTLCLLCLLKIQKTVTPDFFRRCIKDQEDMETLQTKLNEMKGSNISSGERVKRIKKMIESEEKRSSVLLADTEKINSNLYRTDQLLKEQQQIGKTLEIQINNTYCISNKLRKHISDEKKELEKLKEVVYDMVISC